MNAEISRTVVCNECEKPLPKEYAVRDSNDELVHFGCSDTNREAAEQIAQQITGITEIAGVRSDSAVDLQEVR